jgi:hypothetical protein
MEKTPEDRGMNPIELMARLNAASPNLMGGRGGIPEYTAQDIAAAVGMVPDTFAREVFCAVWWPDGARLVWRALDARIAAAQFEQWRERAEKLVDAQLLEAQLEFLPAEARKAGEHRAELALAHAKASLWPALGDPIYGDIRKAAVIELRSPRVCPACKGRATAIDGKLVIACEACSGRGRIAVSDSQRALMIDRNESSYRRTWKDVYEWTFRLLLDAEATARAAFAESLGREAA